MDGAGASVQSPNFESDWNISGLPSVRCYMCKTPNTRGGFASGSWSHGATLELLGDIGYTRTCKRCKNKLLATLTHVRTQYNARFRVDPTPAAGAAATAAASEPSAEATAVASAAATAATSEAGGASAAATAVASTASAAATAASVEEESDQSDAMVYSSRSIIYTHSDTTSDEKTVQSQDHTFFAKVRHPDPRSKQDYSRQVCPLKAARRTQLSSRASQ